MDEIERRLLELVAMGDSGAPGMVAGVVTPGEHPNAAGAKYEPLRVYLVDPADYATEDLYLDANEKELGRPLDYDEWEDQRTKYAKEWC